MNGIEKQKMGMQQNNHSDKEALETINQTPKPHNTHTTHTHTHTHTHTQKTQSH